MSSHQFLSIGKRTSKYDQLIRQPIIKKFRIIPQWQRDPKLNKTQPKQSRQTSFIVKRKSQIRKNRWVNVIKELNKFQDVRNSCIDQLNRKISVRLKKDYSKGKLLKYVHANNCKSLPTIDESFRNGSVFQRLVRRTQPYWKKFVGKN